jgi:hypothetical protein
LNDPFFNRAAASEGSMLVSTVQTRRWFASDEDATGLSFTPYHDDALRLKLGTTRRASLQLLSAFLEFWWMR